MTQQPLRGSMEVGSDTFVKLSSVVATSGTCVSLSYTAICAEMAYRYILATLRAFAPSRP
jgi:hypothetical protein